MLKAALLKMEQEFPSAVIKDGHQCFLRGDVLNVKLSEGLVRARVKGDAGHIYNIHIDFKSWPAQRERCDCSQRFKCKHVASCFFALQQKANLNVLKIKAPEIKPPIIEAQILPGDEILPAEEINWYSEHIGTKNDFFGYKLGIIIDDKQINILPIIIHYLQQFDHTDIDTTADDKLVALPIAKGKWLEIEFGRIKPLLKLLISFGKRTKVKDDYLAIAEYQLMLMREAELAIQSTKARWQGTENFQKKLVSLINKDLPDVEKPRGLQTNLRDYQQQGINWLQFLKSNGFSGILADDMGLGKTVQTLANFQCEKEQGNLNCASLIVAPTSLVGNWFAEASKFTPNLRVLVFHGFDRHNVDFDDYDIVISTYGLMQRDKARFLAYEFYYLILDEAQFIKNSRAKTTKVIQQLNAKHRLCLTGTPLENNLSELWSLFNFLMPGLLGDNKQFRQSFSVPIEKENDLECKKLLNGRISPFILRRTKAEVLQELPLKTEIVRFVELAGPQRDLYEAIRLTMEDKVRMAIKAQGIGRSQIIILDALLKLRQVCCDPRLVPLEEAKIAHSSSAKLDAFMDLLDNLMDEGRSVLVFSQFTSMLKLIEKVLLEREYSYLKLTGETKNRQELVDKFQAGEASIFLISLKAGGTGLNMTKADTVILYDPWWNPAVQEQAAGRSHRIGQKNPVFIYKLIVKGSVEEVIMDIQDKKHDLYNSVLSGQNTPKLSLTQEDIVKFFS